MRNATDDFFVNAYEGKLYVIGGHNCSDEYLSTEIYDPIVDSWCDAKEIKCRIVGCTISLKFFHKNLDEIIYPLENNMFLKHGPISFIVMIKVAILMPQNLTKSTVLF